MKRLTAIVLSLVIMIASMAQMPVVANERKDHWSDPVLKQWMADGKLEALEDLFNDPNQKLTRLQIAKLIDDLFDIDNINREALRGIVQVDWILLGELRDDRPVSREEMIVISSALIAGRDGQSEQGGEIAFEDLDQLSPWAKLALGKVGNRSIFVGSNGRLRPNDKISFAELVVVLDRVENDQEEFGKPGTDGEATEEEVIAKETDEDSDNTSNNNSNDSDSEDSDDEDTIVVSPEFAFEDMTFEDGVIPSSVNLGDASARIIDNNGSKALEVSYDKADFPSVKFTAEDHWEFGADKALSFEVTNPTDKAIKFYLRIDDAKGSDGVTNASVSIIDINPNETKKYFYGLSTDELDYGMRNLPVTEAGKQLAYGWGEKTLNAQNIVEFQLWQMYPKNESILIIDDVKVVNDPNSDRSSMNDVIDAYGQYTGLDWDGKIMNDQDLLDAKVAEASILGTSNAGYTKSTYGGWADGPQLEAKGKFYATKHEGKWTLVDPEGYLYFATGLDITRLDDGNTWVSGRENMFEDIPAQADGKFGHHFSYTTYTARAPFGQSEGWLYNFYAANLERKYGSDYEMAWRDISADRFKDWGFTSIGNWSEPELFHGKGDEIQIPYVANAWTHGDHATIPSGNEFWAPVADPFDPEFLNTVDTIVDEQILAYGVENDEWCMGIYIDNEQAWGDPTDTQRKYALIKSIFAMDADASASYAKRAMMAFLKDKYSDDISGLNTAWGTDLASFDVLAAPYTPATITDEMVPDYSAMLFKLADKYFGIVDAELTKELPDTLYIGSRFAEWGTSVEVQTAAAKYVDVVSFNVYKEDIVGESWMKLEELDMPVIIGEFHFGSPDRGMFGGGLVNATDQEDRGSKYEHYINKVAQSDYFVGAHWFQYYDQPLLGRAWDGENYNVGFVDVSDTPYTDLVASAQDIHSKVYDIKFNGLDISDGPVVTSDVLISFEDGEDLSYITAYKDATVEYVADGATDGAKAMKVNVGTLDTDYSGISFEPTTPWDMTSEPSIRFDAKNPGTEAIQLRSNIVDGDGTTRTFYFNLAAGEERSLEISNLGASADVWGNPDGSFGAPDGLDTSSIAMFNLYLWEDGNAGDTFIVDNYAIKAVASEELPEVTVTTDAAISFELNEDLSFVEAYKDATVEYVADGATNGSRAMKVNVGTLDTDYSGISFTPATPWNMTEEPSIRFDAKNPGTEAIQIRSNVVDGDGATRTFYFNMAAGEARTLEISNLGASADVWGNPDGSFGAADGLDTSNIAMFNLYLWEDGNAGDTFIVDNYKIKIVTSAPVTTGPALEITSFEADEDLAKVSTFEGATTEYVADGATEGDRALKVNLGSLDATYAGVTITPDTAWDLGDTPEITVDVKNPTSNKIQIRSNVVDGTNATRTYYFPVEAGESRTLTFDNFGASAAQWTPDGFWGADAGLDTQDITMMNFYVWENSNEDANFPYDSGDMFILDNHVVSK